MKGNARFVHHPEWLLKLAGKREMDIMYAEDVVITDLDEDYPERRHRLPNGQKHIISSKGRITIDAKQRTIIG